MGNYGLSSFWNYKEVTRTPRNDLLMIFTKRRRIAVSKSSDQWVWPILPNLEVGIAQTKNYRSTRHENQGLRVGMD